MIYASLELVLTLSALPEKISSLNAQPRANGGPIETAKLDVCFDLHCVLS